MMSHYQEIAVEKKGLVGLITLNKPEKMNPFSKRMYADVIDALARFDEDDNVRCIVVTGAGKAFCAGVELKSDEPTFGRSAPVQPDGEELLRTHPFQMKTP